MAEKLRGSKSLIRVWRWAWSQIVQDVPKEIALCEFGCRKEQCAVGEWETCDQRLHEAAGEPMPLPNDPGPKTRNK